MVVTVERSIYIFATTLVSSMNIDEERSLTDIGLTVAEAKVYVTLCELKHSKTGPLCEKVGIPSSKIYAILNSLMKKGLVSYTLRNNTKIFAATSPEILKELFAKKEASLKQEKDVLSHLIDELKTKQQLQPKAEGYRYFEGISGIRSLWLELTDDLKTLPKTEEILVYAGIRKAYETLLGLFEQFHKVRVSRGIKYKIIYPLGESELAKKRRKQLAEARFLDLQNEVEWAIVGKKLIIQNITQKIPKAFVIEDALFVATFRQVFNQIWFTARE